MSSWGRCQDSLYQTLWGYECGSGEFTPGLLHDLGFDRVNALIEPIIESIYEIAYEQGRRSSARED